MKKVLFPILALVLALGLALPMAAVAGANGPVTNYAFVPNAEEASVSKVDLAAGPPAEIARYSTVQPRSGAAYGFDKYRVSRLAMDSGGNAWVLNSMTGRDYDSSGAQGSVARISGGPVAGETPGTDTSNSGGYGGMLDTDVRVTVFDVGDPGDCPRTISIVEEGGNVYLWIGFYMGEYFEKYEYDPVGNTLTSTGDSIDVEPYNGYTAAIDGSGIMWGVSRNASPYPSPSGTPGVFYFDTNDLTAGVTALPYDLPGKSGENPYAIMVKSDGTVWVSDGSNWSTNQARYFAVYTWGTPVTVAYVNTGVNSQAMRGFMEAADGSIWATSIDGKVIQLTETASWVGATILSGMGEMTGIGSDAAGYYWLIQYGLDKMTRFDPLDPLVGQLSVTLGDGPYAYGGFIVPPTYELCGFKYLAGTEDGLEGWEIILEKWVDTEWVPVTSMFTDADGKYCFEDLEAGDYRVSETVEDGWVQVSPYDETQVGNEWVHLVTLPDDASDRESGPFYNFENQPIIEVEKDYRYTNVCFERDNDLDGLFNEDGPEYDAPGVLSDPQVDNDEDGFVNEDPVDCPEGTSLGDPLPTVAADTYQLEAVIHPKNNKVRSYNPGQYYAVSTVTVLGDVETLTIMEDWSDCECIDHPISVLNPKKGGGRVVIVQVGPDDLDGVAYQIMDADSDAIVIDAENCVATATLEDVVAGTTILMYVKFGPGLKGETWDESWGESYGPCENLNKASVLEPPVLIPGEPGDWVEDSANLIVVAKE